MKVKDQVVRFMYLAVFHWNSSSIDLLECSSLCSYKSETNTVVKMQERKRLYKNSSLNSSGEYSGTLHWYTWRYEF